MPLQIQANSQRQEGTYQGCQLPLPQILPSQRMDGLHLHWKKLNGFSCCLLESLEEDQYFLLENKHQRWKDIFLAKELFHYHIKMRKWRKKSKYKGTLSTKWWWSFLSTFHCKNILAAEKHSYSSTKPKHSMDILYIW